MEKTILNKLNNMDSKELDEVINVIRMRRAVLSTDAASEFKKGDKVTFINHGRIEPGVITKVKRKNIEVDILDGSMRYNAPASMLTMSKFQF